MLFVESTEFTLQIRKLIDDESFSILQSMLITNPESGVIIPGTKGCRKIRWGSKGTGKRGGIRVIYYWLKKKSRIILIVAYSKSATADISQNQRAGLVRLVDFILKES